MTLAQGLWLALFYALVLAAPNSLLFSGSGDGLKNYFTYAWHVDHDPGLLHFGGSNYPYGDHVFFTDGHPLLGWALQLLPFLAPWKIGILNISMLLSVVLCSWCLFGLLRRFGVVPWAAALGAFGLTVLEPQLFRMSGHLSLAHCWMFPLAWYALVRTRGSDRWLAWSCLAGLIVLLTFLIHPYAGFMNVLFIASCYACLLAFRWRSHFKSPRTYVEPLVMAVTPMILFLLILNSGDVAADRPGKQIGSEQYVTQLSSLVLPTHAPLDVPFSAMFPLPDPDWESLCYLGLPSLIILLAVVAVQVKRWIGRRSLRMTIDDPGWYLAAAFLVLLFAMQVWQQLLGEWIPILTQFRASGRFAWPFYFVCGVFCVVRAHKYLLVQHAVRKNVALVGFITLIGFYSVEGWWHHVDMCASTNRSPNLFSSSTDDPGYTALLNATQRSTSAAIVPLPFMQVGSDHYLRDAPTNLLSLSYPLALNSGVPLMSGNSIRTSHRNTRDLLAILTPSYFPKYVGKAVPADARFVLLRTNDALDLEEQQLWDRGTPLIENERGALRTITASDLFNCDREQRLAHYARMVPQLPLVGEWRISEDDTVAKQGLVSQVYNVSDSLNGVVKHFLELHVSPPGQLDTALTYELSFLFHALDMDAVNISLILEHALTDGKDGHWEPLRHIRAMPMQLPDGWTVATMSFKPQDPQRLYKFLLHGPDDMDQRYSVHHVLLRPVNVDAWREGNWRGRNVVFLNNVPLANTDDRDR